MGTELMICILSLASFFLFCWVALLRLYIDELDKKTKSLEKYLTVTSKLEDV